MIGPDGVCMSRRWRALRVGRAAAHTAWRAGQGAGPSGAGRRRGAAICAPGSQGWRPAQCHLRAAQHQAGRCDVRFWLCVDRATTAAQTSVHRSFCRSSCKAAARFCCYRTCACEVAQFTVYNAVFPKIKIRYNYCIVQDAGPVGARADNTVADGGSQTPVGSRSAGAKPASDCRARSPKPRAGLPPRRQCRNTRSAAVPRC